MSALAKPRCYNRPRRPLTSRPNCVLEPNTHLKNWTGTRAERIWQENILSYLERVEPVGPVPPHVCAHSPEAKTPWPTPQLPLANTEQVDVRVCLVQLSGYLGNCSSGDTTHFVLNWEVSLTVNMVLKCFPEILTPPGRTVEQAGVCVCWGVFVGRKRVSRSAGRGGERSTAGSNTLPRSARRSPEATSRRRREDVKHMEIKAACVCRPGPAHGSAAPPQLLTTAASTNFLF